MEILVVEDESLIAMELEAALTDAGHLVRGPASTALRARLLADISRPDLALVDINLRDGHGSGVTLARELMQRWHTPSIFVSGQTREAQANKDAAIGHLSPGRMRKGCGVSVVWLLADSVNPGSVSIQGRYRLSAGDAGLMVDKNQGSRDRCIRSGPSGHAGVG